MGLFENIVSNAKQAANVVGKKTGELVDTSKLKLQAVDLNTDIKRNYEALGRAVYEARKQGVDSTEEIDDIIIIINEKYDELDEVNEQLSKMSNKTFCTRCGEPNPKLPDSAANAEKNWCTKYLKMMLMQHKAAAAADVMPRLSHSSKSKHNKNNRLRSKQKIKMRIHKHNWIPIHVKRGEYPLFFYFLF